MVTVDLTAGVVEQAAGVETRLLSTSVTRTRLIRLAMRGLSAAEAAKIVGCHAITARHHYLDPDFRKAVLAKVDGAFAETDAAFIERHKTMAEKLEEQASESFAELQKMLKPHEYGKEIGDSLRYRIHTQFLDRHVESAPVTKTQITVDPMQLQVAAKAAQEMDNVVELKKRA